MSTSLPGSKRSRKTLRGNKHYKELAEKIISAGAEIRWPRGKGHPQVYFRGEHVTSLAMTRSDPRGDKNTIARCRRAGMDIR
ncbi:HicA-like toxin [Gordonia phage Emianna]|uniref:HicA-like toxin n=4 Tax=Foxborovirus TaxID=2948710 RepID=A0A385UBT0_9CAUD|nr:HicA-like toxin [Gordonia phage NatB6]YP_010098265.1 HicA-like toxin [Gordonia phage Foxboro]YP_010098357.1 HicA-like toxin [Gordonia phage KidneyBean]YP_010098897.1 HicA-like toxin [Gordonia phage Emianna]AYD84123.1 HicA-like toxin [Gordonia phage Jifall16]AYD84281.1 HicA-like toxin [Gordonia phage Kurt]QZD98852.1 HicA-like toxin [Gordonia phage Tracker]AXH50289.1 HicA-like toxin [Gordonia phage NatB6]AYB69192.1 HicA-like toxin [Gordonia phage Foxboro]